MLKVKRRRKWCLKILLTDTNGTNRTKIKNKNENFFLRAEINDLNA